MWIRVRYEEYTSFVQSERFRNIIDFSIKTWRVSGVRSVGFPPLLTSQQGNLPPLSLHTSSVREKLIQLSGANRPRPCRLYGQNPTWRQAFIKRCHYLSAASLHNYFLLTGNAKFICVHSLNVLMCMLARSFIKFYLRLFITSGLIKVSIWITNIKNVQ